MENKNTILISAFPCCGKSYCYKNYQNKFIILDSDSSQFSWVKDKNGNNTKTRNPDFPQNYINHIFKNIGQVDFIFISSHEVVRKALQDNKLKYVLVYPEYDCKEEWIKRARDRGSTDNFCEMLNNNWDTFINEMNEITDMKVIKQVISKNDYITLDLLKTLHNYSSFFKAKING